MCSKTNPDIDTGYWDRYTETDRIWTPPRMQRNGTEQSIKQLRCAKQRVEKAAQKHKKLHEITYESENKYIYRYWDRYTETDRILTPPRVQWNGTEQSSRQLRCAKLRVEKAAKKHKICMKSHMSLETNTYINTVTGTQKRTGFGHHRKCNETVQNNQAHS